MEKSKLQEKKKEFEAHIQSCSEDISIPGGEFLQEDEPDDSTGISSLSKKTPDTNWKEVAQCTYFAQTAASWSIIMEMFVSQRSRDDPQKSYHWARIIDHGFFRGLAPKENRFLATILAAVIAQVQGEGVWEAEWAKQAPIPHSAKMIGLALYEMNQASLDVIEGIGTSQPLLQKARELQGRQEVHHNGVQEAKEAEW
ncbi:hypothetical protein ANTRET_LOCUS43 [Anthophora retusa]